tara:strand:+ start:582 stop:758 length:177 start_codon:yes stop_codon:yes gene_type:complete
VRARIGDLVRTVGEYSSDKVFMGVVVRREGAKVWVRWIDDNSVMWMPSQNLEVVGESR